MPVLKSAHVTPGPRAQLQSWVAAWWFRAQAPSAAGLGLNPGPDAGQLFALGPAADHSVLITQFLHCAVESPSQNCEN